MGISVTGGYETAIRLENIGKRSSEAVRQALAKGAKSIRDLAERQAPVDLGGIEASLQINIDARSGINNRNVWEIFIKDIPSGRPNETTHDYAFLVHEGLHGSKLGPKSQAKQDADTSVRVGPFFLSRAVDELEVDIDRAVKEAVRRALREK